MSEVQEDQVVAVARPIITQINTRHAECLGCDEEFREVLVRKCNLAREVGLHLIELKAKQRHGAWLLLFKSSEGKTNRDSVLDMDASTGRNYMRFATAHPEPIESIDDAVTCLKDAMIACGAIPEPHREGTQQRHILPPIGRLTKIGGSLTEVIARWTEEKPVDMWSSEERQAVALQLEPIVQFYNRVVQ